LNDARLKAEELQLDIHRKRSGAERLALALEMSLTARELALTRLRSRHPDWSDSDLGRELIRYTLLSAP
jgi:hypothetical protein